MVKNFDIENFTGFYKAESNIDIFRAGSRVAAGMVVHENDAGSAVRDGAAENLARMDDGSVERTDGYIGKSDYLIFRVEQQNGEMLALFVAQAGHGVFRRVVGRFDDVSVVRRLLAMRSPSSTAAKSVAAFAGPSPLMRVSSLGGTFTMEASPSDL